MQFAEMTSDEVRQAREAGAVVLLPIGSVEPHGPHLPLATDILIAEETARRAAETLEASGRRALVLPSFSYATVEFSAGLPGAVGPKSATAQMALTDLLVTLLDQGFAAVALVNAHLEPAHIAGLRSACESAAMATGRLPVFPDITRKALAAKLTEEFRSGACHAGCYETSLVMAIRPDLVREELRTSLPPIGVSLVEAIGRGARTFLDAGLDRAYCGDPAAATAEEGRKTLDLLAGMIVEGIEKGIEKGMRS